MLEVITDNLGVWTTAQKPKKTVGRGSSNKDEAYGIKKIRELILELAVRGKLVPQDPSDQPASVLLETIADEKQQLVDEGKIKKQKTLSEITEDEKLFDIPNGWEWGRLGDIGNIFNGNSISANIKKIKYTDIADGLPFIATKDVGYGWQEFDYKNGVSIPINEPKFKIAHKGAVLICAEGGSAGKKCGITIQDICFGNKLFAIELYGETESNYLLSYYLSPVFYSKFREKMTGIIGGISLAKLKQLLVPLPPLGEQHRIVAKVEELMLLCDQLEQQQTDNIATHHTLVVTLLNGLMDSAKESVTEGDSDETVGSFFNRLIADHFDILFTTEQSINLLKQTIIQLGVEGKIIPFRGEVKDFLLKDLLDFGPRNGFSPREVSYETKIKVLKLGATSYGQLDLEQSKYIDEDIDVDSHLFLKSGDILIQRGNSASFVGSNVLVKQSFNNFIYPDLMMKLRANELVEPEFLSIALMSPKSREYMWNHMTGTSGTMPKISKKVVEALTIKIPTNREIQIQTVTTITELLDICDSLKVSLIEVDNTKAQLADSIVKQAVN